MHAIPTVLGLLATVAATVLLTAVCPPSWQPWAQLATAVVIASVATATHHGRPVLTREPAPRRVPVDIVDLVAPDRSAVGCVEGHRVVTTAVEITAGTSLITEVGPGHPVDHRGSRLPLAAVARQLDQGGVVLEGIDVVVRGRRASRGDDGEVYSRLVGPLALVSHRRVHLLLRFDLERLASGGAGSTGSPVAAGGAGATRGPAPADGAILAHGAMDRVVAVATERLRRALVHHGMPCRVLGAAELAELYLEAEQPADAGPGLVVRPSARARSVIDRLTEVGAAETTEVVRLRRVEGRRDVVDVVTTVALTGLPSGRTAEEVVEPVRASCHRLRSAAVLPVPGECLPAPVAASLTRHRVEHLVDLSPPAHGAGQILGATRDGGAAATQIAGPHLRSVLLTARPEVCLQVVLRTVASGHRVAVVTDVPDRWRPLLRIGDESRYRILAPDSSDAGAPVDAVVWDVDGPLSEARIDALAGPGGPDVTPPTVIRIEADAELAGADPGGSRDSAPRHAALSAAPPDLVLDGRIDGWLAVEPRTGGSLRVSVVTGPGEDAYFRRSPVGTPGATTEQRPAESEVLTPSGAAPSATPDPL